MAYNSTSWTTDANTKAGSTGTNTVGGVTLYKQFALYDLSVLQNAHYPMLSSFHYSSSSISGDDAFGTGTNAADTLDISAEGANGKYFAACYWYLQDSIYIDNVSVLSNCDATQNTDFQIKSYDMATGSNHGDLSGGTLLAHTASAIENVGASAPTIKQANLTIDSASVAANKVILAFVRNVGGTGDITAQLEIKYHLI